MAGSSSNDLPCSAELEVVGEAVTVERRTRYFTETTVE
jgi:hypothetical protein